MLNPIWSTLAANRELADNKHRLTARMPKVLMCSPHPPKIAPLEDAKARIKREANVHQRVNNYLTSLGFTPAICANSTTIYRYQEELVVWFRYIEFWDQVIVEVSYYKGHRRLTASEFRGWCAKLAKRLRDNNKAVIAITTAKDSQ